MHIQEMLQGVKRGKCGNMLKLLGGFDEESLPYLLPHRTGWSVMIHISVDLWSVKSSSQVDFLVVMICCKGLNFQVLTWWKKQLLILLKWGSRIGHPSKPCFGMAHRLVSVWANSPLFNSHKIYYGKSVKQGMKSWNHAAYVMIPFDMIPYHIISYHMPHHTIPFHIISHHITSICISLSLSLYMGSPGLKSSKWRPW